MVSCGKRGSLLVAGPANIVAANQPLAAASASDDSPMDDIQSVDFMISSVSFFIVHGG
jgi:hypothetical protein